MHFVLLFAERRSDLKNQSSHENTLLTANNSQFDHDQKARSISVSRLKKHKPYNRQPIFDRCGVFSLAIRRPQSLA